MKWAGKERREIWFEILTFNGYNLVLKISFGLSNCLGFANYMSQPNKIITVITLYFTLYKLNCVPYRPEFSTPGTNQERGHMWSMLLWLLSRLGLISTLGELESIFITLKNYC